MLCCFALFKQLCFPLFSHLQNIFQKSKSRTKSTFFRILCNSKFSKVNVLHRLKKSGLAQFLCQLCARKKKSISTINTWHGFLYRLEQLQMLLFGNHDLENGALLPVQQPAELVVVKRTDDNKKSIQKLKMQMAGQQFPPFQG